MGSQRWLVMVAALMVGVAGCNVFWEGASASSQITQPGALDVGDASSDDGSIPDDGSDVLMGDAAPPADLGLDATPPEDGAETDSGDVPPLASDSGDTGEDVIFVDVQDESLAPVDIPVGQDVTDAGSASDVPQDATPSMDVIPMADVVATPDVGQDVSVLDVSFDAGSVVTDGDAAGPSDVVIDAVPMCPMGQTLCSGACVTNASNLDHCGTCGNVCGASSFPNMTRSCQSGQCGSVCSAGFANCDGLIGNGCEVDTRSNIQHCGACGRACTLPNATPSCVAGSCYITSCSAGFASCDGNEVNGCETDTRTNAQHCGACGRTCASPMNGAVSCFNGTCSSRCNDGYAFNAEGACLPADLVVEYVPQLYSGYTVPGQLVRLTESVYGIRVGFPSDGYRARPCDTIPAIFVREGRQWWRCVIRSVSSTDAAASSLLLSVDSPCGFMSGLSCPDRWNEHWRVVLRGRVYESPRDATRFAQSSSCPYGGWMSGCVHLTL